MNVNHFIQRFLSFFCVLGIVLTIPSCSNKKDPVNNSSNLITSLSSSNSEISDQTSSDNILSDVTSQTQNVISSGVDSNSNIPSNNNSQDKTSATSSSSSSSNSKPIVNIKPTVAGKEYFFGITPNNLLTSEWEMYKQMGLKSVRVHLQRHRYWKNNQYDFREYDRILAKAKEYNIEVVMLVSYESYVSNPQSAGGIHVYNDYMNLLDVLEVAIPHFKGKGVSAYEIWNEQNIYWKIDANGYAKLISTIYEKCKYGTNPWDKDVYLVMGGLDGMNTGKIDGVRQDCKNYLKQIYDSSYYKNFKLTHGHSPFDAIGFHNYMTIDVDNNLKCNFNMFESSIKGTIFSVTDAYGDNNMPVWLTEVGDPDALDVLQAAKLRSYMEVAYKMPRVARLHWFSHTYYGNNYTTFGRLAMEEYKQVIADLTNNRSANVAGIKLHKANLELHKLATYQLKALVEPFNAKNKNIIWSSSNNSVATVTNGFVETFSPGTVIITAKTADGGFTAKCTITVSNTADCSFKPGTDDEYSHLVFANCSPYIQPSIDFRFADEYLTFGYQFNIDKSAKRAVVNVTVFQQYKVWISSDNKNWTVFAEETNPANKGRGNKKIIDIDVTKYKNDGKVYVKIGDSFPNDGWGGALNNASITHSYN